jgi:hypothetical protein
MEMKNFEEFSQTQFEETLVLNVEILKLEPPNLSRNVNG